MALLVGVAAALVVVPSAALASGPNLTINSDTLNPSDSTGASQIVSVTYNAGPGLFFFSWGLPELRWGVSHVYVIVNGGTPNTTACAPNNTGPTYGVNCNFPTPAGLAAGSTLDLYFTTAPVEAAGSINTWEAADNSGTSMGTFTGPTTPTGPQATSTTLDAFPSPAFFDEIENLDAMVTVPTSPVTSGTVQFMDGTSVLGTASVNGSGMATITVSNFTDGTHQLVADYLGTSSFASSTSSVFSLVVNPDPPPTWAYSELERLNHGFGSGRHHWVVSEYVEFASPSSALVPTAPTVYMVTVPGASPVSISVPSILPGGTFTGSVGFTVPVPVGFGVFTYPVQVTGGGSSSTSRLDVFDAGAYAIQAPEPEFIAGHAIDARGGHRTVPAVTGKFTPEPASAHNVLAPGVADPNQVVSVQVAIVQASHAREIVESPQAQASAARVSTRGPSATCIDYLGGARFARESVKNGVCTGLHWLNATIETGTDRWYYAFDRAHPLPSGDWIAYARALTLAGLGDPDIRDKFNKRLPYKLVFACGRSDC